MLLLTSLDPRGHRRSSCMACAPCAQCYAHDGPLAGHAGVTRALPCQEFAVNSRGGTPHSKLTSQHSLGFAHGDRLGTARAATASGTGTGETARNYHTRAYLRNDCGCHQGTGKQTGTTRGDGNGVCDRPSRPEVGNPLRDGHCGTAKPQGRSLTARSLAASVASLTSGRVARSLGRRVHEPSSGTPWIARSALDRSSSRALARSQPLPVAPGADRDHVVNLSQLLTRAWPAL